MGIHTEPRFARELFSKLFNNPFCKIHLSVKKSRFLFFHPETNKGKVQALEALQIEYKRYLQGKATEPGGGNPIAGLLVLLFFI